MTSNSDVIGVKVSFWLKADETIMEQMSRWLITQKRPNTFLQNAADAFALAGEGKDGGRTTPHPPSPKFSNSRKHNTSGKRRERGNPGIHGNISFP